MLGIKFAKLFKGVKWLVILWTFVFALITLALTSGLTMILFRYIYLPKAVIDHNIDLVTKSISLPSYSDLLDQQVAVVDLRNVHDISKEDYSIDVILELPRDDFNRKSKSFRIGAILANEPWNNRHYSGNSNVYNTVERMFSLPYHSDLVENCRRLLLLPLYLIGALEEKSIVTVNLWSNAKSPLKAQSHLLIALPLNIWVSSARIQLTTNLSGVRYLLQRYPIITFFFGSTVIFVSQCFTMTIVGLYIYIQLTKSGKQEIYLRPPSIGDKTLVDSSRIEAVKTEERLSDSESSSGMSKIAKRRKKKQRQRT